MSDITSQEYWKEIRELSDSIATECLQETDGDREAAEEMIFDSRLHETIDGHQWIIYTHYNLQILQHSDNSDYMIDNFGDDEAGFILKDRGLSGLHTALAFWAMYADTADHISEALDAAEEQEAA